MVSDYNFIVNLKDVLNAKNTWFDLILFFSSGHFVTSKIFFKKCVAYVNQPVLRVTELPNRSPLPAAHSHSHSSIFKRTNFSSHFSFQGIQIDQSDRWTFISKAINSRERTSILVISREKINLFWIPPKIIFAFFSHI